MAEVTLLYIEMKTRYLILKAADFINITEDPRYGISSSQGGGHPAEVPRRL